MNNHAILLLAERYGLRGDLLALAGAIRLITEGGTRPLNAAALATYLPRVPQDVILGGSSVVSEDRDGSIISKGSFHY